MNGYEHLVAMRRRGTVPMHVVLTADVQRGSELWRLGRDWPAWSPAAQVQVEAGEPVGRLDLRAFVGLPVFVYGDRDETVRALADRCRQHGASRVVAHYGRDEIEDSAGVLTWPK